MHDLIKKIGMLPIIKSRKVPWSKNERLENGHSTMLYPIYDKDVQDFIEQFYELELIDKDYSENYKLIKNKEVNELNLQEILTFLTYYIRGERFYDGMIASILENGKLEEVLTKLNRLSKENANNVNNN